MPGGAGVPNEIVEIVIASIIFFIGISYAIKYLLDKMPSKNDAAKKGDA
jgi:simple sugar transport system permease protein